MVQTKCDDKPASGRVCSYRATCCMVVPLRPDESRLIQQRSCEWVEQALQLQIVDISKHWFDYIPMLSIWWKVTMLPTFQNDSRIVPCEVSISYSPYSHTGRISAVVAVSSRFPKKSAPRFARSVGFTGDVSQLWEEVLPSAGLVWVRICYRFTLYLWLKFHCRLPWLVMFLDQRLDHLCWSLKVLSIRHFNLDAFILWIARRRLLQPRRCRAKPRDELNLNMIFICAYQ